jgi:hypothetical protein
VPRLSVGVDLVATGGSVEPNKRLGTVEVGASTTVRNGVGWGLAGWGLSRVGSEQG